MLNFANRYRVATFFVNNLGLMTHGAYLFVEKMLTKNCAS